MSFSQTARVQTCMCSTMQNRLEDLKLRKKKKQDLFQEVLKKYGKTPKVQEILLNTFQSPHSILTMKEIDRKLQKSLGKIKKPTSMHSTFPQPPHNLPQTKKNLRRPTEDEAWGAIIKLESLNYIQEEQEKYIRSLENRKKLKKILDQQVETKNQMLVKDKIDSIEHDKEQTEYWKALKVREKEFESKVRGKNIKERKMMDEYLAQVRERKVLEGLKSQEYEQALVSKVKDELKREEKEKLAKKEKEKQVRLKIHKENEEKIKEKMLEMEKEKLQDLQIMKDYKSMLEKQEQDRQDYLKNRENRMQTSTAPGSWRVLETLRHKNQSEDLQIYKNMQDHLQAMKAREDLEQEQKAKRAKELKAFYEQQQQDKVRKMREELNNDKKIMENLKAENKKFKKFQEQIENKEKELKFQNAQYLKQQITVRNSFY